ncbi:MAG: hypothetical protein FD126_917 [Elusimicrobia bacterium]|nr:MAG: hypothetical protein FD126_917 [Elusimicrobiota bacterium]
MRLRAAALLALLPSAALAGALYKAELSRVAAQGYRPEASAEASVAGGVLRAAVFRKDTGAQRLYVTLETASAVKTLHMELGGAQAIALASPHAGGKLPELPQGAGRLVAFRLSAPALAQETLVVNRWVDGKFEKTARLTGGRFEDVDGDGTLEVVTRERPLGPLFTIACSSFHTMAQAAYRSDVYAWKGGRLEKASDRHRAFYDRRIAETKRQAAAIDARSTDDYGGFLGLTLSVYFDYAASGRAREGWTEFRKLYPVRASDPGPVKKCLAQMESELKTRLNIPDTW